MEFEFKYKSQGTYPQCGCPCIVLKNWSYLSGILLHTISFYGLRSIYVSVGWMVTLMQIVTAPQNSNSSGYKGCHSLLLLLFIHTQPKRTFSQHVTWVPSTSSLHTAEFMHKHQLLSNSITTELVYSCLQVLYPLLD